MNASSTRGYASAIVLPDKTLLMIGGFNPRDPQGYLTSCEKLDIAANTWSSAGNLRVGRSGPCSVLYNNVVVVIGGLYYVDRLATFPKSCEQYDPISDSWSDFPPLVTGRDSFGAAVVLDKIYVAGGYTTGFIASSSCICRG
jgi:hypothetical protein